jgi:hypothetical protein
LQPAEWLLVFQTDSRHHHHHHGILGHFFLC